MPDTFNTEPDAVLIGAGIMSATLGVLLKELEPSLNIEMFETLEGAGLESSDSWNNAGTGHAANCELNYTPERASPGGQAVGRSNPALARAFQHR
jgi:malate dehydrogenase (quinone)